MTSSSLFHVATQIASLFAPLEFVDDIPHVGQETLRVLLPLQSMHAIQPDLDRVIYLIRRFEKPNPPIREAQKILLEIEGRLYGTMAREGTLPEVVREQFQQLIEGHGLINPSGIERAFRWIREPFAEGLQREMGLRPRGGRAHHTIQTPLELFPALSEHLGREVYLKREDRQYIGSFKIRGAANLLIHELVMGRKRRPCAASHGNHAQGLVQAAANLGFPQVLLFLPTNASPIKIEQCREMGAEVRLVGDTFEEAEDQARAWQAEKPDERILVPAYENPLVSMGQGTIGMEVLLEMTRRGIKLFTTLVPAGGGGMLAGIATWLAPSLLVIGVESDSHPYISESFRAKKIIRPDHYYHVDTDADGIALQRIGQTGFPNILQYARDVIKIPEKFVQGGIAYFHDDGYVAEGAAATPLVALLYRVLQLDTYGLASDTPVVLIYSGRNIDPNRLYEIDTKYGRGLWNELKK
ncbi:MAG: pyridoxal-phosphate dependent enzyme [Deltaproteobacteria bacterium]|nr:pyridoxal-phosphate dependent enzyme [Deltaproteobacteria bacterium]